MLNEICIKVCLRIFRLAAFLFNIIIEVAVTFAKHFIVSELLLLVMLDSFCIGVIR